jgi:hypothetical protein
MNTLLLYGHDPRLLMTRHLLLAAQGYNVLIARSTTEMESICEPVGLLIFCYSVPHDELTPATLLAQALWPSVQVLHLVGLSAFDTRIDGGRHFFVLDGPDKLVSLVRNLVLPSQAEPESDPSATEPEGDPVPA